MLPLINAGSEEGKISKLIAAETLSQRVLGTGIFLLLRGIQSSLFTGDASTASVASGRAEAQDFSIQNQDMSVDKASLLRYSCSQGTVCN